MVAAFLQSDYEPEFAPQAFSHVKSDNQTVAEKQASHNPHQAARSAVCVLNATADAGCRNSLQAEVGRQRGRVSHL